MYICMYIYVCVCVCMYAYMCIYICVYIYVYVYMCICMYIYLFIFLNLVVNKTARFSFFIVRNCFKFPSYFIFVLSHVVL